MLSLVYNAPKTAEMEEGEEKTVTLKLVNEKGLPTPLLIGAAAAEIAVDAAIGFGVFKLLKVLTRI